MQMTKTAVGEGAFGTSRGSSHGYGEESCHASHFGRRLADRKVKELHSAVVDKSTEGPKL